MRKFGLIGYPLGHSFSKGYFTDKFKNEGIFDCTYDTFPLESINDLTHLLKSEPELVGLNVTIPYKELVIPYLDELDVIAKEIGAVNTIKIQKLNNKLFLTGYNTDAFGFSESLKKIISSHHKKALVLGTGGAAKAVAWVLKQMNIDFLLVSRNKKENINCITYNELNHELIQEYLVIINTSPIGMFPKNEFCPDIPYNSITEKHILYDLIYNPEATLFLKKGAQKKATTINGLPMLYFQAEKAWEIWNKI